MRKYRTGDLVEVNIAFGVNDVILCTVCDTPTRGSWVVNYPAKTVVVRPVDGQVHIEHGRFRQTGCHAVNVRDIRGVFSRVDDLDERLFEI